MKVTLALLEQELIAALDTLKLAEERESLASSGTTTARNRVNKAQKAIDDYIGEMKKAAPRSTDWRSGAAGGGK